MSVPEVAPRSGLRGIVAVWIAALLGAVAVAIFVPAGLHVLWLMLALALSVVLAFAIQLSTGRSVGFIQRVAASALGALLIIGAVSLVLGVAAVIPG